jgi:hypothetical protein
MNMTIHFHPVLRLRMNGAIVLRRTPVRRPKERWIDAVDMDDKKMLKCKNWRRLAKDRDVWRQSTEGAKAQVGL